jgi:hypothetical protein
VLACCGAAIQFPLVHEDLPLFLANLIVSATFGAAGALLLRDRRQRAVGWALLAAAILLPIAWINEWSVGPFPFVASVTDPTPILFAVWGILSYPRRWRRRRNAFLVLGALAVLQFLDVLTVLTHPQVPAGEWWWRPWSDDHAYALTLMLYDLGVLISAPVFATLFVVRTLRLPEFERRLLVPFVWVFCVAAATTAAEQGALALHLGDAAINGYFLVDTVSYLGVPLAFLLTVNHRQTAVDVAGRLNRELKYDPSAVAIRDALRRVVGDPGLDLWYFLPEQGAWVDETGASVDPEPAPGRHSYQFRGDDEQVLAAVVTDSMLLPRSGLQDMLQGSVRIALANARLETAIRAEIARETASRSRLISSAERERQALRDAVEQGPLEILRVVWETVAQLPDSVAGLPDIRQALTAAARDLEQLASGASPPTLEEKGLVAAVTDAANRSACPVALHIDTAIIGRATVAGARSEQAAYFIVSEALTNANKHAKATAIHLTLSAAHRRLRVEIADDGGGGARRDGHGIRGMTERATALRGTLTVESDAEHGTRIRADLPYDP